MHSNAVTTPAAPLSEDDSRRQYAYLQAVMSCLPQGVSVFDEFLRLRIWNKGFLEVLDLPENAVFTGVHFADLLRIPAQRGEYGPGDPEAHIRRITELAMKFEAHRFERIRPGGKTHLVQGEPLFIDGKLSGFISTYTDISDRRKNEETLRQQRDLLQTVLKTIPSGISVFNGNLDLVLHNQEFQRLLDLPNALLGADGTLEGIFRFNAERHEYGPGDPETIVGKLLERARTPIPHRIERTRPNGVTLDIRGAPLEGGGFVTIYTDISERRASAEREHLAQMIFRNTPAGIILTDEAHRILSANPATGEMTGYDAFELLGHTVFALTDSEVSPLAPLSVATILVATESPSFFHTMTPLLAVAEILAALVAGNGGQAALAALERTEAQLSAFGVHLTRRTSPERP